MRKEETDWGSFPVQSARDTQMIYFAILPNCHIGKREFESFSY